VHSSKPLTLALAALAATALAVATGCGGGTADDTNTIPPGSLHSPPPAGEMQGAPEPETTQPDGEVPASPDPATPADPAAGPAAPMSPPAAQGAVGDDEVEAFARAYVDVIAIQNRFASEVQQVEPGSDVSHLQEQAQADVESAVQESGLTVEEFEDIGARAGADPELRARIETAVQELQTP
jgi:hypothetical protein